MSGCCSRAPAVEPFDRLKPVAELESIGVKIEVLQDQGERACGFMISRKLMVVEIVADGFVPVTGVDDANSGIIEIGRLRFPP